MSFPRLIFITFVLLSACSTGGNYAPVADINNGARSQGESHVVSRGETLYSIAWARNLEFRGLAKTNSIASPYTIYPGQVLRLRHIGNRVHVRIARREVVVRNPFQRSAFRGNMHGRLRSVQQGTDR